MGTNSPRSTNIPQILRDHYEALSEEEKDAIYYRILTERLIVSARAMGAANEPKRPSVFVGAWGDE